MCHTDGTVCSAADVFADALKHIIEHVFGQPPGECVLLTGVEAADQPPILSEIQFCAVCKSREFSGVPVPVPGIVDHRPPPDLAQAHEDLDRQNSNGLVKPVPAVVKFVPTRSVAGRCTVAGICNGRPGERQTVRQTGGTGLICEARPVQSPEQPVATAIPGEHPTGPVGTVGPWSQPDNQHPGVGVAEIRNGTAPVVFSAVGPPSGCRNRATVFNQTGTFFTGADLLIE